MVFGKTEIPIIIARIIAYCRLNNRLFIDKWRFEETNVIDYVQKVLGRLENLEDEPKTFGDLFKIDWQLLTGELRQKQVDLGKKIITKYIFDDFVTRGASVSTIIGQFTNCAGIFPPELVTHYTQRISSLFLLELIEEIKIQNDLEKFHQFAEYVRRTTVYFAALSANGQHDFFSTIVDGRLKQLEEQITTAEVAYNLSWKKIFVSHWDQLVENELAKAETPDQIWQLFVWSDPWSLAELNCLLKLDKVLQKQ